MSIPIIHCLGEAFQPLADVSGHLSVLGNHQTTSDARTLPECKAFGKSRVPPSPGGADWFVDSQTPSQYTGWNSGAHVLLCSGTAQNVSQAALDF